MTAGREALQQRLRALFVDELAENRAVLSRSLLALERSDDRALDRAEVVNQMFRAAHSLKGGAHSAGLPDLAEICHQMEDTLSRLRDGSLQPSTEVIQPLLDVVDVLGRAEDRLRAGLDVAPGDLRRVGAETGTATVRGLGSESSAGGRVGAMQPTRDNGVRPGTARTPRSGGRLDGSLAEGQGRAPAPVQGSGTVPGSRRDGTTRVTTDRLDALLDQGGELLHASRRVTVLHEDLVAAAAAAAAQARAAGAATSGADIARRWHAMSERLDALARAASDAGREVAAKTETVIASVRHARMIPLLHAYDGLDRVVRDLAREGGKEVRLDVRGGPVEVDRPVLDAVADALVHLVRNAVDHGIEPPEVRQQTGKDRVGTVRVEASLTQDGVIVTVTDDGRGLDLEALRKAAGRRGISLPDDGVPTADLAFQAGVSTARFVTETSGRGVGLDAVRARVEAVGGSVHLTGAMPCGCTASVSVPVALSAVRVVLVASGDEVLGIPTASAVRLMRITPSELRRVGDHQTVLLDGAAVPVLPLADVLGLPSRNGDAGVHPVGVHVGAMPSAAVLLVDRVLSEEEVVMKPIGRGSAAARGLLGATALASGRVALVVNPVTCVREGLALAPSARQGRSAAPDVDRTRPRVLLVEDTITTRALERSILEAAGYDVRVAVDGMEAWQLLEEHGAEIVVSDVDMPRMSGIELCAAIRRSGRFPDLPVILITSLASDADRRRGLEVGANAYLVKAEFDQAVLRDTIERLL